MYFLLQLSKLIKYFSKFQPVYSVDELTLHNALLQTLTATCDTPVSHSDLLATANPAQSIDHLSQPFTAVNAIEQTVLKRVSADGYRKRQHVPI